MADRIAAAWARDTSASADEWTPANPARGQCAVTALVVQDVYGGDLLRAMVGGESHYFNRLPGGEEVDLTRQQFPPDAVVGAAEVRMREYVLSFPETARRYRLLKDRLGEAA
ncbi:MAG TPA: hypothetical protein VD948_08910 [Rhodothermales bacterium]|nr:hypothetical protein [Rhodothermales bacterium]